MEKQDSTPLNVSENNELLIEVTENDLKDISVQNNSLYPKNPSIPKDSDYSNEKLVKEKQGKVVPNVISVNEVNNSINNGNISYQQESGNGDTHDSPLEKEESLQKVIRVKLEDLYKNPINNDQRLLTTQVPKSLEDWIENHSKKALEEPIVSPEKPPSYIPVLETTEDLDEIITPKRSVSCRARNHNALRPVKVINPPQNSLHPLPSHNNINNSANQIINNSYNSSSSRKHIMSRQPMIHLSEHERYTLHRSQGEVSIDTESLRRGQKVPKFQMCSYKQCEFIATDRCEKCFDPLCLNHMKRFYYSLHFFSAKSLCNNCFKKAARFYLWVYLMTGLFSAIVLIILFLNSAIKANINFAVQCLLYIILSTITLGSLILAHLCSTVLTANVTQLPTF